MDWIVDLSQKIATSFDPEGVTTMHEDAFDFVQHQLETIGNAIETVSATIENQLQAIHVDIERYCSISESDVPNSKSVDIENENMEIKGLEISVCSLDLNFPEREKSKLAVEETKTIQLKAPESPMPVFDKSYKDDSKLVDLEDEHVFDSSKGFENISDIVVDLDEKDIKSSYTENENVEPAAQERSVLDRSFTLPDNLDDALMPSECLEEFTRRNCVKYVDDFDSEDFTNGRIIEETQVDNRLHKGFENTFDYVVDSGEKDTKSSYTENENVEPTAQERSVLGRSFTLPDNLDDVLMPNHEFLEEFRRRNCVQYVDDSDSDSDFEDFVDGRSIEEDIEETHIENICAKVDYKRCSVCLNKFKSHSVEIKTCEACDATMKILALEECEQPANTDFVKLLEDESLDWDWDSDLEFCDSDWQVI